MDSFHTMEYCSVIQRNELHTHGTLSESQGHEGNLKKLQDAGSHLYEVPWGVCSQRQEVDGGCQRWVRGDILSGYGFPAGGMAMFWDQIELMPTRPWGHIKCNWIVHFETVSFRWISSFPTILHFAIVYPLYIVALYFHSYICLLGIVCDGELCSIGIFFFFFSIKNF